MIRPAPSITQVCICQKNFIGKTCELRIDTLSPSDKLKYGCELRPCFIGSTCEDRPDGTFVCHCAAVILIKKFYLFLNQIKRIVHTNKKKLK